MRIELHDSGSPGPIEQQSLTQALQHSPSPHSQPQLGFATFAAAALFAAAAIARSSRPSQQPSPHATGTALRIVRLVAVDVVAVRIGAKRVGGIDGFVRAHRAAAGLLIRRSTRARSIATFMRRRMRAVFGFIVPRSAAWRARCGGCRSAACPDGRMLAGSPGGNDRGGLRDG